VYEQLVCVNTLCLRVCAQEMGGYFILNGIERVVRMLIMQRRNYVCIELSLCWCDCTFNCASRSVLLMVCQCVINGHILFLDQTDNMKVSAYLMFMTGTSVYFFTHERKHHHLRIDCTIGFGLFFLSERKLCNC